MDPTAVKLTCPLVHGDALWFAAHAFGWGFRAFEIPRAIVRAELGSDDASPRQLTLAFELGRPRIAEAVGRMTCIYQGERIRLRATDLSS